jgi:hypothetical protein
LRGRKASFTLSAFVAEFQAKAAFVRANLYRSSLHLRHPGVTRALADSFVEAASICLHRHHASPAEYEVLSGGRRYTFVVAWAIPDERCLRAWANETDATEAGAMGVVLAAVEACFGLVAVRRAETRTGADFYIGPPGAGVDDLERCLRLEISGVDRGTAATVLRRAREKVEQAARGASNLPALVGVVGFRVRLIVFDPVEDE